MLNPMPCGAHRWAYQQVVDLLTKVYNNPKGNLGVCVLAGGGAASSPGALSGALLDMAKGISQAKLSIRQVKWSRSVEYTTESSLLWCM